MSGFKDALNDISAVCLFLSTGLAFYQPMVAYLVACHRDMSFFVLSLFNVTQMKRLPCTMGLLCYIIIIY